MTVTIRIPTTLRPLADGASEVKVKEGTVAEVLVALEDLHPGFKEQILDENEQLRRFINIFVSDDDVRFLNGLETDVSDGATVAIVPAVAGGSAAGFTC